MPEILALMEEAKAERAKGRITENYRQMATDIALAVKLCTPDSAEAARRSGNGNWTACTESNLIKIYDAICRQEFHGPHAEQSFILHRTVDGACQLRTIEETGMLLPEEFEELKNKRDGVRGSVAKWYAMWRVCFPPLNALMATRFRTVPASPYIQAMVPPEAGRMATLQVLSAFGIQPQYCQSMSAQILNGLYPAALQGDSEVQQAVQSQQERRKLELRHVIIFGIEFVSAIHLVQMS
uniref:Uncharacterized protein n=1 Tax=Fusarium oxysporum (strain Fo5176) TaxID=660025 RepID=A0A0D2XKJ3_FUSOF